ncbi:MAG: hypothetical protein KME16_05725 [Scytolyngbya sp. HA4215-MV1]|jgi:hypothetical protein|nr:hypothetical protein [Scytolyngbya sp. HA4215-MV1]
MNLESHALKLRSNAYCHLTTPSDPDRCETLGLLQLKAMAGTSPWLEAPPTADDRLLRQSQQENS